jgi:hypothetical protein
MKPACFFAKFDPRPCEYRFNDGRPDPAHLIPAQRLRAAHLPDDDPRLIVASCRRHHDAFDGRDALHKITLAPTDYPASLVDWADEHGFAFRDSRTGWVRGAG